MAVSLTGHRGGAVNSKKTDIFSTLSDRVLWLQSSRAPVHFEWALKRTLEKNHLRPELVTNWSTFLKKISKVRPQYEFILIDPKIKSFDEFALRKVLLGHPHLLKSKVVLMHDQEEDRSNPLQDLLDVDGAIAKSYQPHQIDFVFNRFLFPQGTNKRRHPRALTSTLFNTWYEGLRKTEEMKSIDLSSAGAFLEYSVPIQMGSRIEMEICLPDIIRPLYVTGTVVYNQSPKNKKEVGLVRNGSGIRFEEIGSFDRARLCEYLSPKYLRCERRATERSLVSF